MKNVGLLLCFLFFLTISLPIFSQVKPGKNFIGAKVLLIDYSMPNSADDPGMTSGLEVVYQHNFNNLLSIAIPGKVGTAKIIGDLNNRRLLNLDLLLHLHWYKPEARVVPYLLAGGGVSWEDFDEYNYQIPLGGGFNIRVGRNSYINLQGEYRKSKTENRNNLQAGLGFLYRLGKMEPDTDGDGVKDIVDACPDEAGSAALAGCPDRDGDGIADREDDCPELAGLAARRGCPDKDGDGIIDKDDQCPDLAGVTELFGCPDSDGDGVADRYDQCPNEAGLAANNGCPIADRDKDGIADDMDACPDAAGTKAMRGCPDRDSDGVADVNDRCPELAGTLSGCPDSDGDGLADPDDRCPQEAGPASNRGCPEIRQEVREVLEFAMRAVQFQTGSATLKSESFNVLDQIADIMRQYPSYKLRISGHTDAVGDGRENQVLSEERAKACYQYLVSKSVTPARLSFTGYGEAKPVASNKTSQGRGLNRRVEFELHLE